LLTALVVLGHKLVPDIGGWIGATLAGLGTISYSLYLVHVPIGGKVINLGERFVEGAVPELLLSGIALTISILPAVLFCWAIERPAIKLARRIHKQASDGDAVENSQRV
jgi:peptidoglycan/LPS O-acetylase OafA/YrhL